MENLLRLALLIKPRNNEDWFDFIAMTHAFIVCFIGFLVLFIECALYLNVNEWKIWMTNDNSIFIQSTIMISIFYYIYDFYAIYKIYINSNRDQTKFTYFIGYMTHHSITVLGLILTTFYHKKFGRIVLLCFIVGQFGNIFRDMYNIISRKYIYNKNNSEFKNILHYSYIIHKATYIWTRIGLLQLTWNIVLTLCPYNIIFVSIFLNSFGIIGSAWEYKRAQTNQIIISNNINVNSKDK